MSNLNKSVLKKICVIHKDEVQGLYITHNMFVSRSSRYDRFVNCIINKVDPNMINIPRKPQYRTLAYTKLGKSPNILFDGKNPLKMDELANVKFTSDDECRKLVTNQNEIVKAWINNYNSNTPRKVKSVKFDDIKVNLVDLLNSSKNLSCKYKHTKQTLLALENYVKQNPEVIDIEDSESALLNSNNVFLNSIENEDIDHKPNQISEPLEEVKELHNENIHHDASQNDRLNQIDEPLEEVKELHNENIHHDASQNDRLNQVNEPLEELNDFHNENIHQDASQNDRLNQIDEPLEEVKELHNENIHHDASQNDRLNQVNEPLEELNDFHNENIHQDASQNDRLNQIDEPLEEVKELHNENVYPNANNDDKQIGNDGLLKIDNYYQNKKIDSNLYQDNQQIKINESAEHNKNMDNDLNKDKNIFICNQTNTSFQSNNKRRYMQTEESKDGYKVKNNIQHLSTNKKRIQKEMQHFEKNVKKIELTEDQIALIQNRELNASENLMKSIKKSIMKINELVLKFKEPRGLIKLKEINRENKSGKKRNKSKMYRNKIKSSQYEIARSIVLGEQEDYSDLVNKLEENLERKIKLSKNK